MKRKMICVAMLAIFAGSAASADAAEPLPKALFAYGAINAYMESTWIAKQQGFFRKHNVEVEPVFIIATQAAQAMLAGEVPVGLIGPTHVVNAVVAGGDMVMIMGNQNKVRYQLVAHRSRAAALGGGEIRCHASDGYFTRDRQRRNQRRVSGAGRHGEAEYSVSS